MQSFIERLYNVLHVILFAHRTVKKLYSLFNKVNKSAKNIRCKYSSNIIVSKIFVNNY